MRNEQSGERGAGLSSGGGLWLPTGNAKYRVWSIGCTAIITEVSGRKHELFSVTRNEYLITMFIVESFTLVILYSFLYVVSMATNLVGV
jgi:hypothetical protein